MYVVIIEGEQVPELNIITLFVIEVHKVLHHCFVKSRLEVFPKARREGCVQSSCVHHSENPIEDSRRKVPVGVEIIILP